MLPPQEQALRALRQKLNGTPLDVQPAKTVDDFLRPKKPAEPTALAAATDRLQADTDAHLARSKETVARIFSYDGSKPADDDARCAAVPDESPADNRSDSGDCNSRDRRSRSCSPPDGGAGAAISPVGSPYSRDQRSSWGARSSYSRDRRPSYSRDRRSSRDRDWRSSRDRDRPARLPRSRLAFALPRPALLSLPRPALPLPRPPRPLPLPRPALVP